MGGRSSFIDIKNGNYDFVEGGQKYFSLGFDSKNNIKYLVQPKGSVKIPDYSHTANRIYAIIQNGEVKSIGIYQNHIKVKSIDLKHRHTNKNGEILNEHYHTDLYHKEDAYRLTNEDWKLVSTIIKGVKNYI